MTNVPAKLRLNDVLKRIIISIDKEGAPKIQISRHLVTRRFSEEGVVVNNTYMKVYDREIGVVSKHNLRPEYMAAIWLREPISVIDSMRAQDKVMNAVKEMINEDLAKAQSFYDRIQLPLEGEKSE